MKITIIGSGISGLGAAMALASTHAGTVFERPPRAGAHTRTTRVVDGDRALALDTGFIVHNHATDPRLT